MRRSIFGYLENDAGRGGLKLDRNLARHEEWAEAIMPADIQAEGPESETDRRPLMIFAGVICLALGILLIRLFVLQIISGETNLAVANGNRIRERVSRAPRGVIYDRNGVVLAQNQASFDVVVVPQLLPKEKEKRQALYEKVGTIIGASGAEIGAKAEVTCRTKKTNCLASPIPQLVASGVDRDRALLIDESSSSLPGFALDVNPIRQYKDDNILSVFLGYTGRVNAQEVEADRTYGPTDLIGKLGLEKQYETILRGTNGGERTEVDAAGRPVRVLASRDPIPGNNLVLSIDQELQRKFAEAIQKQITAAGVRRGAGIALNPKTGEILAAVSLPTYDNNAFQRISYTDYEKLKSDLGQPLFNKVISGGYPPGSVIKPFGALAALQENIITPQTIINDTGRLLIPNIYDPSKPSIYHGWERANGLGPVNVLSAIARSSDIFFYEVMGGFTDFTRYLGIDKLADYYKKFGLGSRTGIDLPGEASGRVPTKEWKKHFSGEGWYTGDTYNVSVGQGDLLVSPLQMAVAVSAIANGGTLYKPHLVDRVLDGDGKTIEKIESEIVRSGFLDAQHLATVRKGMWMAVNDPTGTACCRIKEDVPVQVAAKTGTAETVVHDEGVDAKLQSRPNAWFEAFAPYDNPQIAMVVLVENAGEGSQFAAPAVRETLQWYFTQGAGAKR